MTKNEDEREILREFYTAFNFCRDCSYVYSESEKTSQQPPICPNCGKTQRMELWFFLLEIFDLASSIENFYKSYQKSSSNKDIILTQNEANLGVLIIFNVLVEVLLDDFVKRLMCKFKIPIKLQEKILKSNLLIKQKTYEIIPAITDEKWEDIARDLDETNKKYNYDDMLEFCKKARKQRSEYLHEGNQYAIQNDMADKCIDNFEPLLQFFVDLNNKYIAQKGTKIV